MIMLYFVSGSIKFFWPYVLFTAKRVLFLFLSYLFNSTPSARGRTLLVQLRTREMSHHTLHVM